MNMLRRLLPLAFPAALFLVMNCGSDPESAQASFGDASLGDACDDDPDCQEGLYCAASNGTVGRRCAADCSGARPCSGQQLCNRRGQCVANPCDPTEGDPLEGCGDSCTDDDDCAGGTHCAVTDSCSAECIADDDCGGGLTCTRAGRCLAVELGTAGAAGAAGGVSFGGAGGSDVCADFDLEFARLKPTVYLLVDRSGSMNAEFGNIPNSYGDDNRWNVVHHTLLRPAEDGDPGGVVTQLQDEVNFGLMLYTGDRGTGDGNREPTDGECPRLETVAPAESNRGPIASTFVIDDWLESGETPTGEGIAAATAELSMVEGTGEKIIVLATDGAPDTCDEPNPNGTTEAEDFVVAQATAAFTAGVKTFVIFVDDASGAEDHLTEVAKVGVGEERDAPGGGACSDAVTEACFYEASSQDRLAEAFQTIVESVQTCTFEMNGKVAAGSETAGSVVLNGRPLTFDDPDGWTLRNDGTRLILQGDACDDLKASEDPSLTAAFPCGTVVEREIPDIF